MQYRIGSNSDGAGRSVFVCLKIGTVVNHIFFSRIIAEGDEMLDEHACKPQGSSASFFQTLAALRKQRLIVLIVCWMFICSIQGWSQFRKEYVYMGERLIAVENLNSASALEISQVSSSGITNSGATIAWTTNLPSDSQVEYGITAAYGSSTELDSSMVTLHSQTIGGLSANTRYHYRVRSNVDAGNQAISGDYTFDTLSANPPTVTITSPTSQPTYSTTSSPVEIRGNYSEGAGVSNVQYSINSGDFINCVFPFEQPQGFKCSSINLQVGRNDVIVKAVDANQNEGTDLLTVMYVPPSSPPVAEFLSLEHDSSSLGKVWVHFCSYNGNHTHLQRYANSAAGDQSDIMWEIPGQGCLSFPDSFVGKNRIYTYQVQGANGSTVGNWSKILPIRTRYTFDKDNSCDLTVWQPGTGMWNTLLSKTPSQSKSTYLGGANDKPLLGDYDGDGITDVSVWRPSTGYWHIRKSRTPGTVAETFWGMEGDIPVPGDYDRDGITDIAVWRPSTGHWYILKSGAPGTYTAIQWGMEGDVPVPGDYDGDSITDIAVWRPSVGYWYVLSSHIQGTYTATFWGMEGDVPVPGDYDGDGKTDITIWRPDTGYWFVLKSKTPGTYDAIQWGMAGDIPVPADYDAAYDPNTFYPPGFRTDITIWRPSTGTWYILKNDGSYIARQWGASGDVPLGATP
jgi:hypothetical protein